MVGAGVVAGGDRSGFVLARYLSDGSLDSSFGGDGKVRTNLADGLATSLALQADGRVVAAGIQNNRFAVARYTIGGAPDPSFGGGDGLVLTSTILVDPPWRFVNRTGKVAPEHRRLARYRTMETDEIAALPAAGGGAMRIATYRWGGRRHVGQVSADGREVTPLDLRQQRFNAVMRGYDRGEVSAFLNEVADDYENALREADRLRQDPATWQRFEPPALPGWLFRGRPARSAKAAH